MAGLLAKIHLVVSPASLVLGVVILLTLAKAQRVDVSSIITECSNIDPRFPERPK